jgi:poly [ADP-ribose] polymerase 10/14/15
MKSRKMVPDGDVVPARPGNLPCQMLLHAVGPRWQGGNKEEEVKLRKAILRCLELADKDKHRSIAIPALSAGIFGYPVNQSVDTIISSVQFYFKSREGKFSRLEEIIFCDVDDSITTAFIDCLRRKFGQELRKFDADDRPGLSFRNQIKLFENMICILKI